MDGGGGAEPYWPITSLGRKGTHEKCLRRSTVFLISQASPTSALQRSLRSSVVIHWNLLGPSAGVQTGTGARIKGVNGVTDILGPHLDLKSQIAAGRPDIKETQLKTAEAADRCRPWKTPKYKNTQRCRDH